MSIVRSHGLVLELSRETQAHGQGHRRFRPPAILEENNYRLEFCPDARRRPYAFVSTDDINALIHVACFLRISTPIDLMAFLAADGKRIVRMHDRRQIFPVYH